MEDVKDWLPSEEDLLIVESEKLLSETESEVDDEEGGVSLLVGL